MTAICEAGSDHDACAGLGGGCGGGRKAWRIAPYAIGSIAAFWEIDRTVSFI